MLFATIASLFLLRRPANISGLVVLVVVDSVQLVIRTRAFADIGEKVDEVVISFVNYNTSSAMIRMKSSGLISGSPHHSAPSVVSYSSRTAVFCDRRDTIRMRCPVDWNQPAPAGCASLLSVLASFIAAVHPSSFTISPQLSPISKSQFIGTLNVMVCICISLTSRATLISSKL